jgi:hypothetical protein
MAKRFFSKKRKNKTVKLSKEEVERKGFMARVINKGAIPVTQKTDSVIVGATQEEVTTACFNREYGGDSCKKARKKRKNQQMCAKCKARITEEIEKFIAKGGKRLEIHGLPNINKEVPEGQRASVS